MARPIKNGIDYFPHDTALLKNRKFRKLKIKYGILAPYAYISLLELAYSDKGYYIDYSDKERDNVIYAILSDCQGKYTPTPETIADVIESLVAGGLFSADQFKQKVITSKRIQSIYYTSKQKSALIAVNPEIWLLSINEMIELNPNSRILDNFINSELTRDNSELTTVISEIISQRKRNKNKSKQSKTEEIDYQQTTYQSVLDLYNKICTNLQRCITVTQSRANNICELLKAYTIDDLNDIFIKANSTPFLAGNNKTGWTANIDWLLKNDNIVKLKEGAYESSKTESPTKKLLSEREYEAAYLDNLQDNNFDF